jgi:excinuclease ABC subunit B
MKLIEKEKNNRHIIKKNGLTPQPLIQKQVNSLSESLNPYKITGPSTNKNTPNIENANSEQLKKMISHTKREMQRMAKNLNFKEATRLRDELKELEEKLKIKS